MPLLRSTSAADARQRLADAMLDQEDGEEQEEIEDRKPNSFMAGLVVPLALASSRQTRQASADHASAAGDGDHAVERAGEADAAQGSTPTGASTSV